MTFGEVLREITKKYIRSLHCDPHSYRNLPCSGTYKRTFAICTMRRVIRGKFQGHVANKTRIVLFAARELSTDFASLDENKHKKVNRTSRHQDAES